MANEITIKSKYSAKCPHCGLSATGTLTMNDKAYAWLDAAWKAHLDACRAKPVSVDDLVMVSSVTSVNGSRVPDGQYRVTSIDDKNCYIVGANAGYLVRQKDIRSVP